MEVITSGKVVDAVRASLSIPGIFEPVNKKNDILVDGGVLNQVPFDCLKGKVVGIDVTSKAKVPEKINAYENLMYSFYTMRKHMDDNKKKPEIYIQLSLSSIGLLDFQKYAQVKKEVSKEVNKFRKDLKKLIN